MTLVHLSYARCLRAGNAAALEEEDEVVMVVLVANTMCRTELTTLWLRGNHFSSAFCKIIGGSSSSSYALTDIDLSGNHLGDKGLQNLCLFLDKCTNLQSLCVFSVGFIASCVDCALFSLFKHVLSSLFKRNSPSLRCLSRCKLHELSPLQSVVLVPRLQEHFTLCLFSLFSLLFFPLIAAGAGVDDALTLGPVLESHVYARKLRLHCPVAAEQQHHVAELLVESLRGGQGAGVRRAGEDA